MENIQAQQIVLTQKNIIRIAEIQHELIAIDYGYTSMLNGNETVTDRLVRLGYELLNILNDGIR